MDAMDGGLIDGSGGGGGGGSWSDWGFGGGGAGDAAGVMDAQTAVDANAMQHAIAGMGQDNASMLLDPVGTQYVVVGGGAASGNPALDLI